LRTRPHALPQCDRHVACTRLKISFSGHLQGFTRNKKEGCAHSHFRALANRGSTLGNIWGRATVKERENEPVVDLLRQERKRTGLRGTKWELFFAKSTLTYSTHKECMIEQKCPICSTAYNTLCDSFVGWFPEKCDSSFVVSF
jgi:hypothetical protein